MKIPIFLCLLLTLMAIFVQAKSVKKQFRKTSSGKCVEVKGGRSARNEQLYNDKYCEIPKTNRKPSSKVKRNGNKKENQESENGKANLELVKSSKKKRRGEQAARNSLEQAPRKNEAQTSGKPKAAKTSKNSLAALKASKTSAQKNSGKSPTTSSDQKVPKKNKNSDKKKTAPVKRSLPDVKQSGTKKKQTTSINTAPKFPKPKRSAGDVISSGGSKKSKQSNSTNQQQTGSKLPVAEQRASVCYVTYDNGKLDEKRRGCNRLRKPHYLLHSKKCYKKQNGKQENKVEVALSFCDRLGKYPSYEIRNKKCVFKVLKTNLPGRFVKKADCEKKVSVKKSKSAPKNKKKNDGEADDDYNDSDDDEDEDNDGDTDDDEDNEDGTDDDEDNDGGPDDDKDKKGGTDARKVNEGPHSPQPVCKLGHGKYNNQCVDMQGFMEYAGKLPLDRLENFDLGRGMQLATDLQHSLAKAGMLNMDGLREVARGMGIAFFADNDKYSHLESASSHLSRTLNVDYCSLISKYRLTQDSHFKDFIIPCS